MTAPRIYSDGLTAPRIYSDGQIAGTSKKDVVLLPEWIKPFFERHIKEDGQFRFMPLISDIEQLSKILEILSNEAKFMNQKTKILKIAICTDIFDLRKLDKEKVNILSMLLPMVHTCRAFLWATDNHNNRIEIFSGINPTSDLPFEQQRQIAELVCDGPIYELQQENMTKVVEEQVHNLSVAAKANLFHDISTIHYTPFSEYTRALYNTVYYTEHYFSINDMEHVFVDHDNLKEIIKHMVGLKPDSLVDLTIIIVHGKTGYVNMHPHNDWWKINNISQMKLLSGTTQMYDNKIFPKIYDIRKNIENKERLRKGNSVERRQQNNSYTKRYDNATIRKYNNLSTSNRQPNLQYTDAKIGQTIKPKKKDEYTYNNKQYTEHFEDKTRYIRRSESISSMNEEKINSKNNIRRRSESQIYGQDIDDNGFNSTRQNKEYISNEKRRKLSSEHEKQHETNIYYNTKMQERNNSMDKETDPVGKNQKNELNTENIDSSNQTPLPQREYKPNKSIEQIVLEIEELKNVQTKLDEVKDKKITQIFLKECDKKIEILEEMLNNKKIEEENFKVQEQKRIKELREVQEKDCKTSLTLIREKQNNLSMLIVDFKTSFHDSFSKIKEENNQKIEEFIKKYTNNNECMIKIVENLTESRKKEDFLQELEKETILNEQKIKDQKETILTQQQILYEQKEEIMKNLDENNTSHIDLYKIKIEELETDIKNMKEKYTEKIEKYQKENTDDKNLIKEIQEKYLEPLFELIGELTSGKEENKTENTMTKEYFWKILNTDTLRQIIDTQKINLTINKLCNKEYTDTELDEFMDAIEKDGTEEKIAQNKNNDNNQNINEEGNNDALIKTYLPENNTDESIETRQRKKAKNKIES